MSSNNIHPVEFITHGIVQQPLESLNLQLNKLYESQLLVLNLLQSYEQKTSYYSKISQGKQQNNHMLIKTYNDRIYHLKLKLTKINAILDSCTARVDKALNEMID